MVNQIAVPTPYGKYPNFRTQEYKPWGIFRAAEKAAAAD